jgi:hypothetical protein
MFENTGLDKRFLANIARIARATERIADVLEEETKIGGALERPVGSNRGPRGGGAVVGLDGERTEPEERPPGALRRPQEDA